jgi:hypothetical protein
MGVQRVNGLDFDDVNLIIEVPSPATETTMQAIYNACKVYEASLLNLEEGQVIKASCKEPLGGGVLVGITCTLVNGWRLRFEARPGPTTEVCDVTGGNLVAQLEGPADPAPTFQNPIAPSAYVTVTKTSSSSATASESEDIQYSSYQNAVWIDTLNGTAGTTFPIGTRRQPVNNIADANVIAAARGFSDFQIIGNLTLITGDDIDGKRLFGQNTQLSLITVQSAASAIGCSFENAFVTGTLDGDSVIRDCVIQNLNYIEGEVINCLIEEGTIQLGGATEAHFLDCWSGVPGSNTPIIDMGGSGRALTMRGYSGGIKLVNKSGGESVSIDLLSGQIILDATVTAGTIICRGVGNLTDNSTGATVVQSTGLLNQSSIEGAVWDATIDSHVVSGSTGEWLRKKVLTVANFLGLK